MIHLLFRRSLEALSQLAWRNNDERRKRNWQVTKRKACSRTARGRLVGYFYWNPHFAVNYFWNVDACTVLASHETPYMQENISPALLLSIPFNPIKCTLRLLSKLSLMTPMMQRTHQDFAESSCDFLMPPTPCDYVILQCRFRFPFVARPAVAMVAIVGKRLSRAIPGPTNRDIVFKVGKTW